MFKKKRKNFNEDIKIYLSIKYLNLKTRGYSIKEHNDYDSIFEVIDTIQSIFEYED